MNLIDENEEIEQAENKKKIFKIIIIVIAVLVAITIILLIYSAIKNKNTLKLTLGTTSTNTQGVTSKASTTIENPDIFLMSDSKNILVENDEIYISVKKLASVLGEIEYNNDEYKNKGEDKTKCYIKIKGSNEYTSYISGSNEIYKAIIIEESISDTSTNSTSSTSSSSKSTTTETYTEYEYFELQNAVKYVDGEIYASQEAIEIGFNVKVGRDANNKNISIITLDYMEKTALDKVSTAVSASNYSNKKLLKYNLTLVQNSDGNYGIANYANYQEGDYLLSCKYSSIRFCENNGTVIVTTEEDGKQGVLLLDLSIGQTAQTLIEPQYQLIRQLYEESNLYLVKENNKYGILKIEENSATKILDCEYQQIGVDDASLYGGLDSKYVINDKYIPIKINGYWGIITIDGEVKIKPNKYIGIGCNLGENASGDGVIILTDLKGWDDNHKDIITIGDGIVFVSNEDEEGNKTYQIIYVDTGEQYGYDAIEVYSKYENDDTNYYEKIVDANVKIDLYNDLFKTSNSNTSDNTDTNNVVNTTNSTVSDDTTNTNHNNTSSD